MGVLQRLKPGVSVKSLLLSASLIWTVIGGGLLWVGTSWALPIIPLWLLAMAVTIGTLKSFYILDRFALKNSLRIEALPDKTCIGGIYSPRTWLLVIMMMAVGRLLRTSSIPRELIGFLYFVVGWGLLLSSRIAWRTWSRHSGKPGEEI